MPKKDIIYVYRWPIGIFLWLILVLFQIHGSSIGFYAHLLNDAAKDTAIIGINHNFQLDEWAVFTPLAFSQYFSGFPYFSDLPRAAITDVALVYGQACWNLITVFRPFLWGYLFLPVGNALSFFWMGRLIFLFLASFEFGCLILKQNKKLSFSYALLIAFSPIVQWWFNTNSFVEMLIWGQLGILFIHYYFCSNSYWHRGFYAIGLAYCIVAYTVSIYPAWQITFGYIFLCFACWVIYEEHNQMVRTYKDIILGAMMFCLVVFPLAHIVQNSWDTIQAFIHSDYPGQRQTYGGELSWKWLFRYALNYVAPFGFNLMNMPTVTASFISFSPLGIVLAIFYCFKYHIKDKLIWILLPLLGIYVLYFLFPWSAFLSKVTFLSYVPSGRLTPAVDFIQLVILLRVLAYHLPVFNKRNTFLITILYVMFIAWMAYEKIRPEYLYTWLTVILMLSLCACAYILRLRHGLLMIFMVVAFCSGIIANPIARGVQSVYETDLGKAVKKIAETDKGSWIVDNDFTWNETYINFMNSYPIMFGAPTINSVNFYPYWPRWTQFGLTKQQYYVLNRYNHMNITLTNTEPTDFQNAKEGEVIQDIVNIKLNVNDLKKTGATYILSNRNIVDLSTASVQLVPIHQSNGFIIYQVKYHKII